jgi:hypothetical protein
VQGAIADLTSLRTVTIGSGVVLAIVLAAMLLPRTLSVSTSSAG